MATPSDAENWQAATMVGAFLLLGGNATVAWAEQRVPSGLAAVLIAVAPIWMVGWNGCEVGRDRVSMSSWVCCSEPREWRYWCCRRAAGDGWICSVPPC